LPSPSWNFASRNAPVKPPPGDGGRVVVAAEENQPAAAGEVGGGCRRADGAVELSLAVLVDERVLADPGRGVY